MELDFHKTLQKNIRKYAQIKSQLRVRLGLFRFDPYNPQLRNHKLTWKCVDYRTINIAVDIRAVYKYDWVLDVAFLADLRTHNELYK